MFVTSLKQILHKPEHTLEIRPILAIRFNNSIENIHSLNVWVLVVEIGQSLGAADEIEEHEVLLRHPGLGQHIQGHLR